ncbi:MAG TPA: hypothetical protein PKB09_01035 [Candidatus Saccharibacteria bacterium]|nr:hypothetical protein [Candidatus Saccharibacteria bacterium]
MPKKQIAKNNNMHNLALAGSILATLYFIYGTIRLVIDIPYGLLGSPANYAAIIALVLGIYVWLYSKDRLHKYVLIAVFTSVVIGYSVWFFGLTTGKNYVPGVNEQQTQGLCPDELMLAGEPSLCDSN